MAVRCRPTPGRQRSLHLDVSALGRIGDHLTEIDFAGDVGLLHHRNDIPFLDGSPTPDGAWLYGVRGQYKGITADRVTRPPGTNAIWKLPSDVDIVLRVNVMPRKAVLMPKSSCCARFSAAADQSLLGGQRSVQIPCACGFRPSNVVAIASPARPVKFLLPLAVELVLVQHPATSLPPASSLPRLSEKPGHVDATLPESPNDTTPFSFTVDQQRSNRLPLPSCRRDDSLVQPQTPARCNLAHGGCGSQDRCILSRSPAKPCVA